MLTAAIGAAPGTIDAAYDVERMYQYLDYVHVMCYDYHGKWDKKTGHNSPLRPRPSDSGDDLILNVDYTLQVMMMIMMMKMKMMMIMMMIMIMMMSSYDLLKYPR